MGTKRLKEKIAAGQAVFGSNLQIDSAFLVEMIGAAGFDYVLLDCEHGYCLPSLPALVIAAENAGLTPIIRPPSHERSVCMQALETGAGGIQVPMVETPQEARELIRLAKFPPLGQRGYSRATRAAGYGALDPQDLGPVLNAETLLIVQLETLRGIENAAEISKMEGVDGIFIGPGDLSQSMGLHGREGADEVLNLVEETLSKLDSGVIRSVSAFDADQVRRWRSRGVGMVLTSSMLPIRDAFASLLCELRGEGVE